jgi:hypothetical protein
MDGGIKLSSHGDRFVCVYTIHIMYRDTEIYGYIHIYLCMYVFIHIYKQMHIIYIYIYIYINIYIASVCILAMSTKKV